MSIQLFLIYVCPSRDILSIFIYFILHLMPLSRHISCFTYFELLYLFCTHCTHIMLNYLLFLFLENKDLKLYEESSFWFPSPFRGFKNWIEIIFSNSLQNPTFILCGRMAGYNFQSSPSFNQADVQPTSRQLRLTSGRHHAVTFSCLAGPLPTTTGHSSRLLPVECEFRGRVMETHSSQRATSSRDGQSPVVALVATQPGGQTRLGSRVLILSASFCGCTRAAPTAAPAELTHLPRPYTSPCLTSSTRLSASFCGCTCAAPRLHRRS